MNTKNAFYKSIILLSILSILLTFYLYPSLPAEIPIHFDYAGTPDNFGPRSFALLTASLPLISIVVFKVLPKLDPKRASYQLHAKAYGIFISFISFLFIGFHWVTLFIVLGVDLPVHKIIPLGIGMLFIILGNYMPQIRPNYTYGIRLPWTLADENNWRATHRIGGYCYIVSGIFFIIISFAPPSFVSLCILLALICIFLPMVYSYIYFKREISK